MIEDSKSSGKWPVALPEDVGRKFDGALVPHPRLRSSSGWLMLTPGVDSAFSMLKTPLDFALVELVAFLRRKPETDRPWQASAVLVTSGPYRITRNPMYVGLTVAYLGEEVILLQLWPVVFLALAIVYVHRTVIPLEEDHLEEAYGERYREYRSRVRRWISATGLT